MTNTYRPHVGGVARSVQSFSEEYRRRGHEVLTVCPTFEGAPASEQGVLRVPAVQRFNGSDFSVVVRMPAEQRRAAEAFGPDIVHAHHPFLLGGTALRMARRLSLPIVFTHHTMYERYTHYVPGHSPAMIRFAIRLSTAYANLCDAVIAPSESTAAVLRERGVTVPIQVIPTGVRIEDFAKGSGSGFRDVVGIPRDAFVVGHVGRLAPEKNIALLADALAAFLKSMPAAQALVAGRGPSAHDLTEAARRAGVADRMHLLGPLEPPFLTSAYHAMDAFAFCSETETQGMVLTEAMAAGVPVVAVDAPGAREVVRDGANGFLLPFFTLNAFADRLRRIAEAGAEERRAMQVAARQTAARFSMETTAGAALALYEGLRAHPRREPDRADEELADLLRLLRLEWDMVSAIAGLPRKADRSARH